jgi:hypothetical protein
MIDDSTYSTSHGAVGDGSEFRNKFPNFSESTIGNISLQQLQACRE